MKMAMEVSEPLTVVWASRSIVFVNRCIDCFRGNTKNTVSLFPDLSWGEEGRMSREPLKAQLAKLVALGFTVSSISGFRSALFPHSWSGSTRSNSYDHFRLQQWEQ